VESSGALDAGGGVAAAAGDDEHAEEHQRGAGQGQRVGEVAEPEDAPECHEHHLHVADRRRAAGGLALQAAGEAELAITAVTPTPANSANSAGEPHG
jgi:hypothetical protein